MGEQVRFRVLKWRLRGMMVGEQLPGRKVVHFSPDAYGDMCVWTEVVEPYDDKDSVGVVVIPTGEHVIDENIEHVMSCGHNGLILHLYQEVKV